MQAYGHAELNTVKFTNVNYIENRIKNHKDVFSDTLLKRIEIDDTFPDYIVKNKKKI